MGREAALKRNKRSAMLCSECLSRKRKRRALRAATKLDFTDLLRCQLVCRHMDLKQNMQEPLEKFFWLKEVSKVDTNKPKEEEEEEEKEDVLSIGEKLETLIHYLRQTYNFCVYCGTIYTDKTNMLEECPGAYRQSHYPNLN